MVLTVGLPASVLIRDSMQTKIYRNSVSISMYMYCELKNLTTSIRGTAIVQQNTLLASANQSYD